MRTSLPVSLHADDLAILPPALAQTLPAHWYTDPAFLQSDLSVIHEPQWQLIGHVSQLEHIGSHIMATVSGKPIFVVRGEDQQLRGFYNVCQHRAGPIVRENGCSRSLVCKYHGWTYGLDGQLRRTPEMDGVEKLQPERIHLKAIFVSEWQGFVFVALQEPQTTIDEMLAGIVEQIQPIDLTQMQFERRVVYQIHCNWKIYVDNYLEGYHLPLVHPGLSKILDYRAYNTQLFKWYSYQHSPIDATTGPYASGDAHYYFVYPNLMLNILPNRLQTNVVIPVSSSQCEVVFDYYYAHRELPSVQKLMEEDLHFANEVQQEDIDICELVQKGLASGAYHAGRLSVKRESGVLHFHDHLRRAYANAMNATRV